MADLKLEVRRKVDAVECPNELFSLSKLGRECFGIYRLVDGLFSLVDKIEGESICVFKEYSELKGLANEYYDFYLFYLEDKSQQLVAIGSKNVTEIDDVDWFSSEEFNRLLYRTKDFVIIEALNGDRKKMSLDMGEMFEDMDYDEYGDSDCFIYEVETGIYTMIKPSESEGMQSIYFSGWWDEVDDTFIIVDLASSEGQALIRINDLQCSPAFFNIDYYEDEYGNFIKEYVWIENESGEVAVMRVNDFKVSKFYSSGEELTSEFAIFEDEEGDEIIVRLSDFSEARFFKNGNGTILI